MRSPSFVSLVTLALALPNFASAAVQPAASALELHPAPQVIEINDPKEISLAANAAIVTPTKADPDAQKLLTELLRKGAPQGGKIQKITLTLASDPAAKDLIANLPSISGAYQILVRDNQLIVIGFDARGQYYAMQTLRQLLNANGDPSDLPNVMIRDFPAVPSRGTVEGFYGNPWSHEKRISQLKFYGLHKMDTYIYGPKDDPFHSAQWRTPYPPEQAKKIQELTTIAAENKVDFVWAIHPGGSIRWTPEDYQNVAKKFEQMYQLGVRSFAVFFDDIGGEGTKPEKQADLLNWLNREFVEKKHDVMPLTMCPTEYNKSWANPKPGGYLDILGEQLHPSIRVMWTGNSVVADLKVPDMEYINKRLKRKAYIWWNYPVTDFVGGRILMGRVYGNDRESAAMMSGFVSNPMEHAEASKVALVGVADYAWNPQKFDSTTAWEHALAEIAPDALDAFRVFCVHNSDLAPNGHGYRREESVAIAPIAKKLTDSLTSGNIDESAAKEIFTEYQRIAAAPNVIRQRVKNPLLLGEIEPWLATYEELGQAGQNALRSLGAKDTETAWTSYLTASRAIDASTTHTFRQINGHNQIVTVSTLVMTPLMKQLHQAAGSKILQAQSQGSAITAISNSRSNGIEKILTAAPKPNEYFYSEQNQQENDWIGVKFATPTLVKNVFIAMGRNDNDGDYIYGGQLEGSSDQGKTWTPLAPPSNVRSPFFLLEKPLVLDQVRYRITTVGTPERKNFWLAVRQFACNAALPLPSLESNIASLKEKPVQQTNQAIFLAPQLEVFTFEPNQSLTLKLPALLALQGARIDMKAPDAKSWLKFETSTDLGATWKTIDQATAKNTELSFSALGKINAVRVSTTKKVEGVSLKTFELQLANPDLASSSFTDQNLDSKSTLTTRQVIPIPAGKRTATILAGLEDSSQINVALTTNASGQQVVRSLKLQRSHNEIPLPSNAKFLMLQSSSPNATVHEVLWK